MPKFHTSNDGLLRPCSADVQACRLGIPAAEHLTMTQKEADAANQATLEKQMGGAVPQSISKREAISRRQEKDEASRGPQSKRGSVNIEGLRMHNALDNFGEKYQDAAGETRYRVWDEDGNVTHEGFKSREEAESQAKSNLHEAFAKKRHRLLAGKKLKPQSLLTPENLAAMVSQAGMEDVKRVDYYKNGIIIITKRNGAIMQMVNEVKLTGMGYMATVNCYNPAGVRVRKLEMEHCDTVGEFQSSMDTMKGVWSGLK